MERRRERVKGTKIEGRDLTSREKRKVSAYVAKLCLGYRISISTDLMNYVAHFQWPLYDTFQSHDTGVFYKCSIIITRFII